MIRSFKLIMYSYIDREGTKYWNLNNQLHREDGPAVEYISGSKEWWIYGNRHRIDGPAIEDINGSKSWYLNGNLHRIDGPARESPDGYKSWWVNNNLHRVDGPAIETSSDGGKRWYINGEKVSQEYVESLMVISKFRKRVKSLLIPRWYKLFLLTKTKAFCEWYYHPDNIGGKIAKQRLANIF